MLYEVLVNGEAPAWSPVESEPEPFTLPNGDPGTRPGAMLAVDKARALLERDAPAQGGEYAVQVSCKSPWTDSAGKPHAPGLVSSFSVFLEPAPEHRAAYEAELAKAEAKAERDKLKAELLAELKAEGKAL